MEISMDEIKFQEIKERALEEHIPIIMDDTLEALNKLLEKVSLDRILEIGTATRIFCNLFF